MSILPDEDEEEKEEKEYKGEINFTHENILENLDKHIKNIEKQISDIKTRWLKILDDWEGSETRNCILVRLSEDLIAKYGELNGDLMNKEKYLYTSLKKAIKEKIVLKSLILTECGTIEKVKKTLRNFEIYKKIKEGIKQKDIALEYGISVSDVNYIHRKTRIT